MAKRKKIDPEEIIEAEPFQSDEPLSETEAAFDALIDQELEKEKAKQEQRFTSPIDIGKTIRGLVKDFPAWETQPDDLAQGVLCPVHLFALEIGGPDDIYYCYAVQIYAGSFGELRRMIDFMILAGNREVEHDGLVIYLHAVQGHDKFDRIAGQNLYHVELKYIFRAKAAEANLQEV
jgi:hypothetical protein